MSQEVFQAVFNGFWDLYLLHSQVESLSAKKLLAWIQQINLVVNSQNQAQEEDQEQRSELVALVMVKLVKKKPEQEEYSEKEGAEPVQIRESDLEDVPIDDKCLQIRTQHEGKQVLIIN